MKVLLMLYMMLYTAGPELSVYRNLLDSSLSSLETANKFSAQLKEVTEQDAPILIGFKAMSEFMLSKHLINPLSKLSRFNKGKKLLELAIKKSPHSIELYYFRFSTQGNVPSILKYSSNMDADKIKLIQYLKANSNQSKTDTELYKRIKKYLLESAHCSTEEKSTIIDL